MTNIVYVIKVFQGLQVVKQYVEKAKDIADIIAEGIESLGYEVAIQEVRIDARIAQETYRKTFKADI